MFKGQNLIGLMCTSGGTCVFGPNLHGRHRQYRSKNYLQHPVYYPVSTVILRRCIRVDRQYRPYSPVGVSVSTADIDRDGIDRLIYRWIYIDLSLSKDQGVLIELKEFPNQKSVSKCQNRFFPFDQNQCFSRGEKKSVLMDDIHPIPC